MLLLAPAGQPAPHTVAGGQSGSTQVTVADEQAAPLFTADSEPVNSQAAALLSSVPLGQLQYHQVTMKSMIIPAQGKAGQYLTMYLSICLVLHLPCQHLYQGLLLTNKQQFRDFQEARELLLRNHLAKVIVTMLVIIMNMMIRHKERLLQEKRKHRFLLIQLWLLWSFPK